MAFSWCTIHVLDYDKSVTFYQDVVGLTMVRAMDTDELKLAFLKEPESETQIELVWRNAATTYVSTDQISIGFTVKSLEAKIAELQNKGIALYRQPVQPNPSLKFFFIKDPDGVSIQFIEFL